MIQGGGLYQLYDRLHDDSRTNRIDFTKHNGSGGESIYGGTFADEDLGKPLDTEGYAYCH